MNYYVIALAVLCFAQTSNAVQHNKTSKQQLMIITHQKQKRMTKKVLLQKVVRDRFKRVRYGTDLELIKRRREECQQSRIKRSARTTAEGRAGLVCLKRPYLF